jgi:cytosine/adenosine deaminase-related metal-dependent hydrolase
LTRTVAATVEADWTWLGDRFHSGVRIYVAGDGRIGRVGTDGAGPVRRLAGRALLPGFVNAHSHAFQRGLRGHGELYPAEAGSFWTWREAMYDLVSNLDAETAYRWSRLAFDEMRAAGVTTVGEFHYLHHFDPEAADFGFDDVVLEAAHDAGVRLVLLETYYRTGGIDRPLEGAQRRFAVSDPEVYWRQMEALGGRMRGPHQTLGAVAHSLRAAEPAEVAALHAEACRRGLVFHIHLEEQRQEIEATRSRYGESPVVLMLREL